MRTKKQQPPVTLDVLTGRLFISVREYACLTGVPRPTIYSLVSRGRIAGAVRIGSAIRIPTTTLKAMVT